MTLLIYYIALVLLADFASIMLCLWIERVWPPASLPVFLALYFLALWVAWIVAVRLTKPKAASLALQDRPAE
jgi:hypothetical protein